MRYVNHETGERMEEKPGTMTHLAGDRLVSKDHPRIVFRGMLDLLEGKVVAAQGLLETLGRWPGLVEDLDEAAALLGRLSRSEALEEGPGELVLFGLTARELREQSHHPEGYFGVAPMTRPHRSLGLAWALLNELRGEVRRAEVLGVAAFPRPTPAQGELLAALDRLSSALHVLMCRTLAGHYG